MFEENLKEKSKAKQRSIDMGSKLGLTYSSEGKKKNTYQRQTSSQNYQLNCCRLNLVLKEKKKSTVKLNEKVTVLFEIYVR